MQSLNPAPMTPLVYISPIERSWWDYNNRDNPDAENSMRLDIKTFALTCGIVCGFGVFFGTWWIIALDGPQGDMPLLGSVYRGFTVTPIGSVIALVWALIDGLIGGAIFAGLYNKLLPRAAVGA
jgi:hypothetical protein